MVYGEDSCDKETYQALELGVRHYYNNEVESNGICESTDKGNISAVEKIINLKVIIPGSMNLFFVSLTGPRCVR